MMLTVSRHDTKKRGGSPVRRLGGAAARLFAPPVDNTPRSARPDRDGEPRLVRLAMVPAVTR